MAHFCSLLKIRTTSIVPLSGKKPNCISSTVTILQSLLLAPFPPPSSHETHQSMCVPICPLKSHKHIAKSPSECIFRSCQLITKRLPFFQTSSTLRNIPTNHPQHILFKNNSHHSFTYTSHFYHLFTLLLPHHNSRTTNSISFSRLPQPISPSFHPKHPSTLPTPPHLLQTTHINHPRSQFLTNFSPSSLRLPKFYIPNCTP